VKRSFQNCPEMLLYIGIDKHELNIFFFIEQFIELNMNSGGFRDIEEYKKYHHQQKKTILCITCLVA
jgi:hypothetical protein